MKKFFLSLLVMASMCLSANAQFFVSGTLGLQYRSDVFSMKLLPGVGYELSDRLAIGVEGGFNLYDGDFQGLLNPYARFNFWNNEKLFLDGKAAAKLTFGDGYTGTFIGVLPSLRYAVNDKLQLAADIGFLGVDIEKYKHFKAEVNPAFGLKIYGVDLTVIYKF